MTGAPPGDGERDLRISGLAAERDYFREVAERLGRKSLNDTQDCSRLIDHLRDTEAELRRGRERLELEVAARAAELTRSNRDLARATARYDELVRRIPHGVYTLRIDADEAMRFEYLSPQLCNLLGYEPALLLADPMAAYASAHPDDLNELRRTNVEATRAGTPLRWEGRFDVAGETRWIRLEADQTALSGGDVLWSGVASDVTEHRLAQDRLRESEEMYRQVTELAPNPITVADLTGTIRLLNQRSLDLFGHTHEREALGRSIFEWVAPASQERARERFSELMAASRVLNVELELLRGDGTPFAGEISASLVRDAQGLPWLVILFVTDLTQRRQVEAERLKLQKMEAIGTLAGGLAHDFNNLLQGVFGHISLARAKLTEPAAAAAMLAEAEAATGQAVSLTSQLLTFAKGGKPRKERLALPGVVEKAARFALSGTSTVCELTAADDLSDADADEGQIVQVVQNIVLNASQAMPRGGLVRIDLRNVEIPRGHDEALPDGGRFVAVRIADTGVGITPAILPNIFEPYFTTRQSGSGLGLATSWSIVQRHGGTIRVESEPGCGAAFEVLLPTASTTRTAGAAAAGPARAGGASRRCRVLVMDDEELVRAVAAAMLESLGHEAFEAVDGLDAVQRVEQASAGGNPYDLVILDLTVRGGMGGGEAIGRIRALTPEVRAIVSSGYSDSAVVADFRAHGFDANLNKPYTIETLRDCLAGLLGR